MKSILLASATAISCFAAAGSVSAQTIFTDRAAFLAATTNQTVSNFEDIQIDATGARFYGLNYTGNGFSISNSEFVFAVSPQNSSYNYNSGQLLTVQDGTGSISIGSGFSAFGFDYGKGSQGNGSLDLFINGVAYQSIRPNLGFFGIVGSTGLSPISFRINGGLGVIDNVTTAMAAPIRNPDPVASPVPEPAAWAMMLTGFAMVGSMMRVRHRRVRFA